MALSSLDRQPLRQSKKILVSTIARMAIGPDKQARTEPVAGTITLTSTAKGLRLVPLAGDGSRMKRYTVGAPRRNVHHRPAHGQGNALVRPGRIETPTLPRRLKRSCQRREWLSRCLTSCSSWATIAAFPSLSKQERIPMRIRRTQLSVLMLLLCGGSFAFALWISTAWPAVAADASAGRSDGKADPAAASPARTPQRFGWMIGLRPEKKRKIHPPPCEMRPEVVATLKKCHIQNYSIYVGEIEGKLYLFSYFEYTGEDMAKDMAVMKADAKTHKWWTHTNPCQIRLPNTKPGDWWKGIPEAFHMD